MFLVIIIFHQRMIKIKEDTIKLKALLSKNISRIHLDKLPIKISEQDLQESSTSKDFLLYLFHGLKFTTFHLLSAMVAIWTNPKTITNAQNLITCKQ